MASIVITSGFVNFGKVAKNNSALKTLRFQNVGDTNALLTKLTAGGVFTLKDPVDSLYKSEITVNKTLKAGFEAGTTYYINTDGTLTKTNTGIIAGVGTAEGNLSVGIFYDVFLQDTAGELILDHNSQPFQTTDI
jgi:hypothetical protein